MAYIKENCKCLEKSKFFADTCGSTKFVFTNSGKEDADKRRWKYLVIFLLKSSKLYFLSLGGASSSQGNLEACQALLPAFLGLGQ